MIVRAWCNFIMANTGQVLLPLDGEVDETLCRTLSDLALCDLLSRVLECFEVLVAARWGRPASLRLRHAHARVDARVQNFLLCQVVQGFVLGRGNLIPVPSSIH